MGHISIVKLLLEEGVDPNIQDKDGKPIVLSMSRKGNTEMIKLFISYSGNVHLSDNSHKNALHYSAFYGHFETTRFLVSIGVNFKAENENGKTPLQIAEDQNADQLIIEYLRQVEKK